MSDMLKFAINFGHPIAIRYPRGEAFDGLKEWRAPVRYGKGEVIYDESDIALVAVGSMVKTALEVRSRLREAGYSCTLVNARFVKPLDEELLRRLAAEHKLVATLEENVLSGGFGEHVTQYLNQCGTDARIVNIAIPDEYVEHGNVDILRKETGIDADSIVKKLIAEYIGL